MRPKALTRAVNRLLPVVAAVSILAALVPATAEAAVRRSVVTKLSRADAMHLALMSSENRAAHALGRTYPGGLQTFVGLMNAKAKALGMKDTQYVEPTGLSSRNQSSAKDLATLVNVAYQ